MAEPTVTKDIEEVDPRTRAQVKKELHEKKTKERADAIKQKQAHWQSIKDTPAIADLLAKSKGFVAYHTKMAKDGVGARNKGVDESGAPIIEDVVLSSQDRIAHLDQAKGIEQIIAYVENNTK